MAQPLLPTRGFDNLTVELRNGGPRSPRWSLVLAFIWLLFLLPGPLLGWWSIPAFALLVALGGIFWRRRVPHGSVALSLAGGEVRVTPTAWIFPPPKLAGETLPLAELTDAWAGSRGVRHGEVNLLVLRFTGNRYMELPAAAHDEAELAELAEEIKALGRAAESRAGEVPEALRALRDGASA